MFHSLGRSDCQTVVGSQVCESQNLHKNVRSGHCWRAATPTTHSQEHKRLALPRLAQGNSERLPSRPMVGWRTIACVHELTPLTTFKFLVRRIKLVALVPGRTAESAAVAWRVRLVRRRKSRNVTWVSNYGQFGLFLLRKNIAQKLLAWIAKK